MRKILVRKITALGAAALLLLAYPFDTASAWGAAGHSIVAEIAQRRLSHQAAARVRDLLGRGHSLASTASWADDVRDARPYSSAWHYVDIPAADDHFIAARDCAASAEGDCVLAELDRVAHDLRCAPTALEQAEALKYAVHFIGDLHQPLHTLLEERGGNGVQVTLDTHGLICRNTCPALTTNLHSAWDTGLIEKTTWNWGAYVDRLEGGFLRTEEARAARGGAPLQWALDAHAAAQRIWAMTPADHVLNDDYYRAALPILDRQLALGGFYLADFLNAAFSRDCEERYAANWRARRRLPRR